jgi:hypothetical protein
VRTCAASILLVLALVGCPSGLRGSGTVKTERREVPAFTGLEVGGFFEVEVTAGKPQSVELSGDDNILPLVTTEVRSGVLVVSTRERVLPRQPLKLVVSVSKLTQLGISGAGSARASGIDAVDFKFRLSGAASATVSGAVKTLYAGISGAGGLHASDLRAEAVEVRISGAASAEVHATRSLTARISGAGHVRYRGKPAEVKPEVSGVGSVTPID